MTHEMKNNHLLEAMQERSAYECSAECLANEVFDHMEMKIRQFKGENILFERSGTSFIFGYENGNTHQETRLINEVIGSASEIDIDISHYSVRYIETDRINLTIVRIHSFLG